MQFWEKRIIGVDLMIRILKPSDIDAVMNIWLSSNIQAHSFYTKEYWMKYFGQSKRNAAGCYRICI